MGQIPICAYCNQEIDGPVLTALAPNATKAQKFHPYHFMCCYCQKVGFNWAKISINEIIWFRH